MVDLLDGERAWKSVIWMADLRDDGWALRLEIEKAVQLGDAMASLKGGQRVWLKASMWEKRSGCELVQPLEKRLEQE